jgi:hypothetical protein
MAKGKHKTNRSRSERIELACELFGKAWSDSDVARELKVARNTARSYREIYEQRLKKATEDNPRFLQNIVGNTMRMIEENLLIVKTAWQEYHRATKPIKVECPRCERGFKIPSPDYDTRNKLLKTILSAHETRAKLYGAMGVKQEFVAMVANVERAQKKLIEFMVNELCDGCRDKLLAYMSTPEMAQYLSPAGEIEAPAWEEDEEEPVPA